jgi:hypothetical protein
MTSGFDPHKISNSLSIFFRSLLKRKIIKGDERLNDFIILLPEFTSMATNNLCGSPAIPAEEK